VIIVTIVTEPTLPRAVGVTELKITVTPCDGQKSAALIPKRYRTKTPISGTVTNTTTKRRDEMIDTERLATDRAYWDSVAPEGATHYDPEDMDAPWMMKTTRNWMFYWGSKKEWVEYAQKAMITRILARLVIRPDAPEEWDGTGLPPVGVECEH